MSHKYTLAIITASNCPGCIGFKKMYLKDLLKILSDKNIVGVYQLDFADKGNIQIDPKLNINPDIRKYIAFFPSFVLLDTKTLYDANSKALGISMYTIPSIVGERVTGIDKKAEISFKPDVIVKWIETSLKEKFGYDIQSIQNNSNNSNIQGIQNNSNIQGIQSNLKMIPRNPNLNMNSSNTLNTLNNLNSSNNNINQTHYPTRNWMMYKPTDPEEDE